MLFRSDHAIGLCYDKGDYIDCEKRDKRIKKVALKHKHSSVLEFAVFTFDITASTKVLLEMTRHRMASYACKSSRYTLNKGEKVVFCLRARGEDDRVHDLSMMTFVAIHEMGHITSISEHHSAEFKSNFSWLLENAVKAGI